MDLSWTSKIFLKSGVKYILRECKCSTKFKCTKEKSMKQNLKIDSKSDFIKNKSRSQT